MLLLAHLALASCPERPTLRDPDSTLSLLSQNLQFIAIGKARADRAGLLASWLENDGAKVDLLLLSEARDPDTLGENLPGWCFYAQDGGRQPGYQWRPDGKPRSPGGLVLGVRRREGGALRPIELGAGQAYQSRAVTFAEGLLGPLAGFVKGWAEAAVDGVSLRWTHTQASYARQPERGAGGEGRGRAGQLAELAASLPVSSPVLLTGDLNLLDGFDAPDRARFAPAQARDERTVADFFAQTGMDLFAPRHCPSGTFLGSVYTEEPSDSPFVGATFDRVGINAPFRERFPATEVGCTEIRSGSLRVSDHLGVLVDVQGFGG